MKPWSVLLATLTIAGLSPAWDQSGIAADEPKPAVPAPPKAEKGKGADFSSPVTSVNTFFAALKGHDHGDLARAVALRSITEAKGEKNQKLFTAILEQSLSDAALRDLASEFEGYKIVGTKPTGARVRVGVVVEKMGRDGKRFERTITVRTEKVGWKVSDLSEPKELEKQKPLLR